MIHIRDESTDYNTGPFVYDTYYDEAVKLPSSASAEIKMYNRGPILNNEERLHIHKWAIGLIPKMRILTNFRLDYKLNDDDSNIIPIITEIRKRIEKIENLSSYERENDVGDFVAVIPTNGFIHKHCDPNVLERQLFHVRFNVFITIPKLSGNTYYDGHIVETVEGSYALCRSGIDEHWSDPNNDTVPRISLSFGYLLPPKKVDELCRDASIGKYTKYYPLSESGIPGTLIIEERGDENGSNVFTMCNVFNTSQCDEIVNYINENESLWDKRDLGYASGNNVECKFLSMKELIKNGVTGSTRIDELIFNRINAILNSFILIRPDFRGVHDDGYTLRRIHGGTKRHIDGVHSKTGGFTKFVRALSLIIILNDDYDGGIFNFPSQNLKLKVKKGEAIMFPPYWTHPHSVTSVGKGQARYAINTWLLENFID